MESNKSTFPDDKCGRTRQVNNEVQDNMNGLLDTCNGQAENDQLSSVHHREQSAVQGMLQENDTELSDLNLTDESATSSENDLINEANSLRLALKSEYPLTCQQLGIVTERPKRCEFAWREERLSSFAGKWPRNHPIRTEHLADAGFIYAGYGDSVRCFYCGGRLRNWDVDDSPLVEHARYFPKCAFLRNLHGQPFIDSVQNLNRSGQHKISLEEVLSSLPANHRPTDPLYRHIAVLSVVETCDFDKEEVVRAAASLRQQGEPLAADRILREVYRLKGIDTPDDCKVEDLEIARLRSEVETQRENFKCKICMDNQVSVIFLPCGHFCVCQACADATNTCPVCRNQVLGTVTASLG